MSNVQNTHHPYFQVDFEQNAKSHHFKHTMWKVAKAISIVAIMSLSSMFIYSISFALNSNIIIFQISLGFLAGFFGYIHNKISSIASNHLQLAKDNEDMKEELDNIKSTNLKKICKQYKIKPKQNIEPLLARYITIFKKMAKVVAEITDLEKGLKEVTNQKVKDQVQKNIHDLHENQLLPLKFLLAETYHIMQNPNTQKNLKDFGKTQKLSFLSRFTNIINGYPDCYFVFNSKTQEEKNEAGISFQDSITNDIPDLAKLIFD